MLFQFAAILSLAIAVTGEQPSQIPVQSAIVSGPCCIECVDQPRTCLTRFAQDDRSEPCTVGLCEISVADTIDGSLDSGLDLNLLHSPGSGQVSIQLELGFVSMF